MLRSTARLLGPRCLGGQRLAESFFFSCIFRKMHSISFALAAHREHGIRPEQGTEDRRSQAFWWTVENILWQFSLFLNRFDLPSCTNPFRMILEQCKRQATSISRYAVTLLEQCQRQATSISRYAVTTRRSGPQAVFRDSRRTGYSRPYLAACSFVNAIVGT